ncbi:tRNA 2-thiocytidine(32) synthetase TtcA [Anoxybacter fermentans]|uniref:tRNA 2-thiocytidine(32) synthetase TtcA n=1 Tax=Anoxybacter fermentans TaxID=1323375 RepID=A0A3Q9HS61_9FIRM|nr:tRNA 2-thiocytidine biosynthesis TtcA family protein [Anoxybacter fermentans]AZR74451.1 tRNA 2-thiocytidine(32) synthetase TtcA [Anoxybacter fermentans]
MRLSLPRTYVKKIWRAIVEFDLIQANDRIMIGFSGGKDSSFLAYALSVLKKSAPIPFEVEAVHIDLGFNPDFDFGRFYKFFEQIEIPFHVEHTRIQEIVFSKGEKSACARCAYFRRGAVNSYAKERGCNKVAYAHHYDDAVETFLLSILYSGQVSTFLPRTYLTESKLTVIRPLVYLREKEIREAKKFTGYEPIISPCPMDGCTKRAEVKNLIRQLTRKNKMVFYNVAAAMCENSIGDMWPKRLTGEEFAAKMKEFWSLKYSDLED